MSSKNELTTNEYWDKMYVSGTEKTHTINLSLNLASREVDLYFKKFLPLGDETKKFIEIGCAPGSWMHYFHQEFGYSVSGLDYTEHGVEMTKKNMKLLGIEASIYKEDLFVNTLEKGSYDMVFSSGFIEHFEDPFASVQAHYELVKPGGILILKIPNLSGLNGWIEKKLDREVYEKHNIAMMSKDYFKNIPERIPQLEVIDISYVGKINLCLFIGRKFLMMLFQAIQLMLSLLYKITGSRLFPLKDSSISPYIIAIYRRKV